MLKSWVQRLDKRHRVETLFLFVVFYLSAWLNGFPFHHYQGSVWFGMLYFNSVCLIYDHLLIVLNCPPEWKTWECSSHILIVFVKPAAIDIWREINENEWFERLCEQRTCVGVSTAEQRSPQPFALFLKQIWLIMPPLCPTRIFWKETELYT